MKLIIDRAKWLRGEDQGRLLRGSDGKMCCLGFYGIACGIPVTFLLEQGLPSETEPERWPEWLVYRDDERSDDRYYDSRACDRLTSVNDDRKITEAERETGIAEEFAKHGVTVEFVEDAPTAPMSVHDPAEDLEVIP